MKNIIGGRIEKVKIHRVCKNGYTCIGYLGKTESSCFVENGAKHVGESCLIRFNIECEGSTKRGYFITSEVPEDFQGLAKEDYVLVSEWKPEMRRPSRSPLSITPTLYEIKRVYNPGDLHTAGFVRGGFTGKKGRYIIRKGSRRSIFSSWGKMLRMLPKPGDQARLIVVEQGGKLESLVERIKQEGLIPIRMEPVF